jgi:cellulose synthase/poly-beta-1,6-N-acetylglucosamine synthase-like glycosyltransferase
MSVAKIMIAIPNMGMLATRLVEKFDRWTSIYGAVIWMPIYQQPVAYARNICVDRFMKSQMTHLWFVDSDTIPPPDALGSLLAADKDAVTGVVHSMSFDYASGNEWGRRFPVVMRHGRPVTDGRGVERVDSCGSACILLTRRVFEAIPGPPWYEQGSWGEAARGEDFQFCARMAEAGVELYAHFGVTCAHLKQAPL